MRQTGKPRQHVSARSQHRAISRNQRKWAADADRDAKYNEKRAKQEHARGNVVLARSYAGEAKVDHQWAAKRRAIADREEKNAKNART